MDALYALAQAPQAARDRGRRAGDRLVVAGPAASAASATSSCSASIRTRTSRRSRAARWSSTTSDEAGAVETLRFHGIARLPDGTRDVVVAGGKFNLPGRERARSACGQLARLARVQCAAARRWWPATSRAFAPTRRASFRTRGIPATRPDTAGTCSRRCCRSPTSRSPARNSARRCEARGIGTGVSYESAHLTTACRRFGYHRGDLPVTEHIADTTVTLPLFPTMTDADVDRVCAACAEVLAAHRR